MRIHTHVVFDAETLETLSDASFEYQGEVGLCLSGGSGQLVEVKYAGLH